MRVVRGPLIVLFLISFAGAGALAASGAPPFASAAPTRFEPFSEPQASASPLPARPAGVASPVASPRVLPVVSGVASQAASSSDTVAVASQTDQKLTLVDTATGTSHAFDLGIPPRSMARAPNGRTA